MNQCIESGSTKLYSVVLQAFLWTGAWSTGGSCLARIVEQGGIFMHNDKLDEHANVLVHKYISIVINIE